MGNFWKIFKKSPLTFGKILEADGAKFLKFRRNFQKLLRKFKNTFGKFV